MKPWKFWIWRAAFVFVLALSGYARADVPIDREVAVSVDVDVDVGSYNLVVDSQLFFVQEGVWVEVPSYAVLKCCAVELCGHEDDCNAFYLRTRLDVQYALKKILTLDWDNGGPKHRWIRA